MLSPVRHSSRGNQVSCGVWSDGDRLLPFQESAMSSVERLEPEPEPELEPEPDEPEPEDNGYRV